MVVITLTNCLLSGKAEVVEFDENSLDQEPIPPDVFYTRRGFDSHEGATPVCVIFSLSVFVLFLASCFSPSLLTPARVSANSSITLMQSTRCISVRTASGGTTRVASPRMVIHPPNRPTNACRTS
jgi:hypothetical protein